MGKWIFFFIVLSQKTWALAPIESIVLGNFSETYLESETDPLNYIFSRDKRSDKKIGKPGENKFKRELASYRGFYEEGKNTLNYCKNKSGIEYKSEWEKTQVMRSVFAEAQYIGLDLLSRSIPEYAKALEFTRDEYSNLIEGLVGNSCSANLSVISKKELKNNLFIKFDKENNFILPNIKGNPYFPDNMDSYAPIKLGIEHEFKLSLKLFQALCSWGGDPYRPMQLGKILSNPALFAFFVRQMTNLEINWVELSNSLTLVENKKTIQVNCHHLICRKTSSEDFYQNIFYSIGGTSFGEDLRRLYCQEFKGELKGELTLEEKFINSQFIALITGIPDFLLRLEKLNKSEDLFRSSMDYTWNAWAMAQSDILSRELYFEEPLTLELIGRKSYFSPSEGKLKIAADINLGEYDRVTEKSGKIKVHFFLSIQNSFLLYFREVMKDLDPRDTKENERLLKRFKQQFIADLIKARNKLIIPPWKGDLESLIALELTEQLLLIPDSKFKIQNTGFMRVEVELNYGLFALKYINHQKMMLESNLKNHLK